MKIIFFFFLFFFHPSFIEAASIQSFDVLNGIISREFESDNNIYSVILNEGETSLEFRYTLKEENATLNIFNNIYKENAENKTIIEVTSENGQKEEYVFYLEKDNTIAVFNDYQYSNNKNTKKEIPNLKIYVISGCGIIIVFLFKIIILGFKKKN